MPTSRDRTHRACARVTRQACATSRAPVPIGPAPRVLRASSVPQFDDVAVRVGEICIGKPAAVLALAKQLATSSLDLVHGFIQIPGPNGKSEVRHSAATDRFAHTCLAKGDGILRARRMEKNHGLAFPESNLQSQRLLVEACRAMDVADVQVDVIQHARRDHRSYLLAGY